MDRVEVSLSQMTEENTRRQLSAELLARRALNKGYYGYAGDVVLLYEQARPLLDDDTSYARALLKKAQALAFFARGEVSSALPGKQAYGSIDLRGMQRDIYKLLLNFYERVMHHSERKWLQMVMTFRTTDTILSLVDDQEAMFPQVAKGHI